MRRRFEAWAFVMVGLAAACVAGPGRALAGPPSRIVSLNVCTDQILLDLVPRERIAAVSHLAADPTISASAEAAHGLTSLRGTAEEVLALNPDLVIAGEYTTPATVSLLGRLGRPVVVVPLATTFEGLRETIRVMARAVEEPTRGEAMIAAFDRRLAALPPVGIGRPTALAYQANSIASGPGSMLDAAMETAGLRNLARDLPLDHAGRLGLETLVTNPPDLIVLGHDPAGIRSTSADNLRHPALASVLRTRSHIYLGMPLWLCATPRVADAVEALARLRVALSANVATRRIGTTGVWR